MENASKALLIAGGILVSIIIISLFVSMYGKMSSLQQTQEKKKEMEQISEFNAEYEAFDKGVMYGTDVMTVMKKAIENNTKKNAKSGELNYINIQLKINQNYQSTVVIEDLVNKGSTVTKVGQDAVNLVAEFGITISSKELKAGATYELGSWTDNEDQLQMDEGIVDFFSSDSEDFTKTKTHYNESKVYYIYSALTNFKTSRFKCEGVEYDNNGRIKEMKFLEYKNN